MVAPSNTVLTYRYESFRAVSAGIIEAASGTFLLLIAVRWFHAGAFAKGCVAAGSGLGYLLTPVVVGAVSRSGMPAARAASRLAGAGAVALALAAAVPVLPVYVLASLLSLASAGAIWPLLTQIYQDNYPAHSRGRFFSRTVMIRIATAAAFSSAAGRLLAADIGYFRALLLVFSAAMAFAAWCLSRVPSRPLAGDAGRNPLRVFITVRDDRVFRATLIAWMLMGFANLMMLPLRVEFLANPKYGTRPSTRHHRALHGRRTEPRAAGRESDLGLALRPGELFRASDDTQSRIRDRHPLVFHERLAGWARDSGDGLRHLNRRQRPCLEPLGYEDRAARPRRRLHERAHVLYGVRGLTAPMVGFALVAVWPMTVLGFISAGFIVLATLLLVPEARVRHPAREPVPPTLRPCRRMKAKP